MSRHQRIQREPAVVDNQKESNKSDIEQSDQTVASRIIAVE